MVTSTKLKRKQYLDTCIYRHIYICICIYIYIHIIAMAIGWRSTSPASLGGPLFFKLLHVLAVCPKHIRIFSIQKGGNKIWSRETYPFFICVKLGDLWIMHGTRMSFCPN